MTDTFATQQTDPFTEAGSGGEGLKFADVGATHTGIVQNVTERNDTNMAGELQTWNDGSPKKVYVFDVLQADGETRRLFVRGNMVKAMREAVAAAGLKTVIGATVTVQHHALGEAKAGRNAAKLYRVKLDPPRPPVAGVETPW